MAVSRILLLLCSYFAFLIPSLGDGNGDTLLGLKWEDGIEDPYGHLADWGSSQPYCTWTGIVCNSSGAIAGLNLAYLNLSGTLPLPLASLAATLTSINISGNSFTGPFPLPILNLTNLLTLDISRNFFVGLLPQGFSNLQSLLTFTAFSNNFTGSLPVDIAQISTLRHLDLGGSFFSGTIPSQYGLLTQLHYLGLSGNLLEGRIPAQLGNLSELEHMVIGYNKYSTTIPPEFGNLKKLQYLDLCCTNLSGSVPAQLGKLVSLNTLFLYQNSLTGVIPAELGNMSSLMSLDLSFNFLSGSIPEELGKLHNLTLLSFMYNSFHGSLPEAIGHLPNLLTLLVWNNSFTGSLPSMLGQSSALEWLDASSNFFTGSIPSNLCMHNNLSKLLLFSNLFTGAIPGSLAKCQALLRVRIHSNKLSGSIPAGFGSLLKLTHVELQKNQLSGFIPLDLTRAPRLSYLDVSFNRLEGSLPPDTWRMPLLQSFSAAANKLSGSIPSEIGGECKLLTIIDLSQNSLTGEIPASFGICEKLVTIRLQQNGLTGAIPEELARMLDLEVLDLSENRLTGVIPMQFQNSTALEAFNVSYNNLSGPVPAGGMFKTANPSSFLGNPRLCGGNLLQPCFASYGFTSNNRVTRISSGMLVLLVLGVLAASVVAVIGCGRCLYRRYLIHNSWSRKGGKDEDMEDWPWRLTAFQRLPFSSSDILECLKDENIIGRGATGTVYKAEMPSGDVVAVKKLWMSYFNGNKGKVRNGLNNIHRMIQAEADLLGSIRHRNIVKLLGYCSNNGTTGLLIYEYMRNGSLQDALHSKEKTNVLADWVTRYNIALGIAQGLSYLHHDCFPRIIHRDVKSNNILLDCDMEARVADFGVAKLIENKESMSIVAGSYGYIAPEYAYTLKVDEKTDIYSFGVVLLELLTGRRPIEAEFGDAVSIVGWVRGKIKSKEGVVDVLDPNVGATCKWVQEEMLLVLRIALLCTTPSPKDRPSMRDVLTMLVEAKPRRKSALISPTTPTTTTQDQINETLLPTNSTCF